MYREFCDPYFDYFTHSEDVEEISKIQAELNVVNDRWTGVYYLRYYYEHEGGLEVWITPFPKPCAKRTRYYLVQTFGNGY